MTLDELDTLFSFLYRKGPAYTKYEDIKRDCFSDDPAKDVEGLTIKMHKDGFLDSGAVTNHGVIIGYSQQGIYKLSFAGRMEYENTFKDLSGKPYHSISRREKRKEAWNVVKIVAAVLNATLIIAIGVYSIVAASKTSDEENKIKQLTIERDSLKSLINKKPIH